MNSINWKYSSEDGDIGSWCDFEWGYVVCLPVRDYLGKTSWKCFLTDRNNNLNIESRFCSSEWEAQSCVDELLNDRIDTIKDVK